MARVIVGMSGGVDSAVAAYLLKQQGHEVIGVMLRSWVAEDGTESRCCEIDDAQRIAWKIGIPFHVYNCLSEFREAVTRPFVRDYICGLTPNPCIECNRYVKWEKLLYVAQVMQADYVATGHYASVVQLPNGRYTVKRAVHTEKDQAYMLYKLTQEQLSRTLTPLGGFTKEEVRRIAAEAEIPVADKPDSQEICFVPDGDYASYVEANAESEVPGEGNFVDGVGRVIGRHKGIIHYTVGQRKGLGIALGHPAYIKTINAETNEITVTEEDALYTGGIVCRDVNYQSVEEPEPGTVLRGLVKVRYHHEGQTADIRVTEPGMVRITFDEPVRAAAPGQSSVWYDEDGCVIGGGIIVSAD
ncbi:MAG: tRNA 2-thiouridine(34) synthase MnmA [Lachnospiraceae bacterium]|nr:tRNA 2-thiouridine(34) synthase MnmA [Lachnospiraceae bacterium]